jgi:hypothetical protein
MFSMFKKEKKKSVSSIQIGTNKVEREKKKKKKKQLRKQKPSKSIRTCIIFNTRENKIEFEMTYFAKHTHYGEYFFILFYLNFLCALKSSLDC